MVILFRLEGGPQRKRRNINYFKPFQLKCVISDWLRTTTVWNGLFSFIAMIIVAITVGRVVTLGHLGGVMVSTKTQNARDVGSRRS